MRRRRGQTGGGGTPSCMGGSGVVFGQSGGATGGTGRTTAKEVVGGGVGTPTRLDQGGSAGGWG